MGIQTIIYTSTQLIATVPLLLLVTCFKHRRKFHPKPILYHPPNKNNPPPHTHKRKEKRGKKKKKRENPPLHTTFPSLPPPPPGKTSVALSLAPAPAPTSPSIYYYAQSFSSLSASPSRANLWLFILSYPLSKHHNASFPCSAALLEVPFDLPTPPFNQLSYLTNLATGSIPNTAAMSPRRSSRARPTASALAHHSSSSSTSSTRASSSRLNRLQDEPLDHDVSFKDDAAAFDARHRNPSTMADTNEVEGADNDVDETGSQDDEEITRCICGFQEYQGEDDQADTSDGLFIQCDKCHVWQHGFCVGITDKALAPDNYFCEKCRPEYHKLGVRSHGWVLASFSSEVHFSNLPNTVGASLEDKQTDYYNN